MESDWKKLLEDDNNFSQDVPYDFQKVLKNFEKCEEDLDNLNPFYLLCPIYDCTKFFGKISSALGMGFKDITEKVNQMRKKFEDYPSAKSIQSLIQTEMRMEIHKLNGSNNHKHGHKKGEYKEYCSASRTFLRLMWFMEFIIHIFRKLVTEKDMSLKDILKNSYNEVLSPKHTFGVRTAVGVALTFSSCKKSEAIKFIFGDDELNEECKKKITHITDVMETIWKACYEYYKKYDLLNLE